MKIYSIPKKSLSNAIFSPPSTEYVYKPIEYVFAFINSDAFLGKVPTAISFEHQLKSRFAWTLCTEYEVRVKNGTTAMTKAKAKMKFLLGHNMKIVFSGGNQPLVGEVYWGTFADWGGGVDKNYGQ